MELRTRILTPKLRAELKKPFGILIQGPMELTTGKLKELIAKRKPPKLISVGDATTSSLIKFGIPPDLCIVDHKILRKPIKPVPMKVPQTLHASNPPGTITKEAWLAVERGINANQKTQIVVDGEEDLLVIPAVILTPERSIVAYGQLNQGIVVVEVTKRNKLKCRQIIDSMEEEGGIDKTRKVKVKDDGFTSTHNEEATWRSK